MTSLDAQPLQSSLSYCNLKDAEDELQTNGEAATYMEEIESYNALASVLESPLKQQRASLEETPLDELLVSVQSWSDIKGYTEYTVSVHHASLQRSVTTGHRFSDFLALHSRICAPLGLATQFPVPKTPFVTDGVKCYRMRALQGYLRHACVAAATCMDTVRTEIGPTSEATPGSKLPLALSEFLGFEVRTPAAAQLRPHLTARRSLLSIGPG